MADAPNAVWSADFKGQFPTGDGQLCYPLTVTDNFSRFLLGCDALPSVRQEGVFPVFTRLFQEYGLPEAIRTDNGNPFASSALVRTLPAERLVAQAGHPAPEDRPGTAPAERAARAHAQDAQEGDGAAPGAGPRGPAAALRRLAA